jgi:hypothetical protein
MLNTLKSWSNRTAAKISLVIIMDEFSQNDVTQLVYKLIENFSLMNLIFIDSFFNYSNLSKYILIYFKTYW